MYGQPERESFFLQPVNRFDLLLYGVPLSAEVRHYTDNAYHGLDSGTYATQIKDLNRRH